MPTSHTIDHDQQLNRVTIAGKASLSDCIDAIGDVVHDPQFVPDWPIVADLTSIEYYPASSDIEVLTKAMADCKGSLTAPIGLAVGNSVLLFAAKLACSFVASAGIAMRAFEDVEAAQIWCIREHQRASV